MHLNRLRKILEKIYEFEKGEECINEELDMLLESTKTENRNCSYKTISKIEYNNEDISRGQ